MFLGFGLPFFSHLIGFLYPAFASFKAIEARPAVPAATSTREEVQWCVGGGCRVGSGKQGRLGGLLRYEVMPRAVLS